MSELPVMHPRTCSLSNCQSCHLHFEVPLDRDRRSNGDAVQLCMLRCCRCDGQLCWKEPERTHQRVRVEQFDLLRCCFSTRECYLWQGCRQAGLVVSVLSKSEVTVGMFRHDCSCRQVALLDLVKLHTPTQLTSRVTPRGRQSLR